MDNTNIAKFQLTGDFAAKILMLPRTKYMRLDALLYSMEIIIEPQRWSYFMLFKVIFENFNLLNFLFLVVVYQKTFSIQTIFVILSPNFAPGEQP